MANSKELSPQAQELAARLDKLRADLYKMVDDTILNVARACVGVSADVLEEFISAVFMPMSNVATNVADAAPAMAPETPSPTNVASNTSAPKRQKTGRKVDWANASKKAVYEAIRRRVRANKPIEPELNAAAIKLFPISYNPENHTFKLIGNPKSTGRKADWANASKESVYVAIKKRIRANKPIEPELNAAAIKFFPKSYNPESHTFKRIGNPKSTGRKTDWANASKASVYAAYYARVKAGKDIEPELEAALIKWYQNSYDPNTHIIVKQRKRSVAVVKPKAPVKQSVPMPQVKNEIMAMTGLTSTKNINGNYSLMFAGETMLLRGNKNPYELVLFDKRTQTAIVRKKADDTHHKLFIIRCKKGKVVEELRNGAGDIYYMPQTHEFMARPAIESSRQYFMFLPDGKVEIRKFAPDVAISLRARQFFKETLVIEKDGTVSNYEFINLSETDKNAVKINDNVTIKQDKENTFTEPTVAAKDPAPVVTEHKAQVNPSAAPRPKAADKKDNKERLIAAYYKARRNGDIGQALHCALMETFPEEYDPDTLILRVPASMRPIRKDKTIRAEWNTPVLTAVAKLSRMSPDGAYYDVYVNGVQILHDHVDTKLETFMNGTVLGVHGIATDIPNLPTQPSWQLYDVNMARKSFTQTDPITKKNIYIKNVRPHGPNQLELDMSCSNKTRYLMDAKQLGRIFEISKENTK